MERADIMLKTVGKKLANEKLTKILFYGLLSILIGLMIVSNKLDNMDEIWNFSHARWVMLGLIPYKDISIIVTPLSIFLNSLFLRINSSLLMFRIIYLGYYIVLIYLLDRLCDLLNIKKLIKYIFIFSMMLVLVDRCYLDYNFIQFILIILLMYLSLKNKNYNNKKLNLVIPLITGVTILNKQSTGLIIAFVLILLTLINKFYLKKDVSYQFIIKQMVLVLMPSVLFVIYLLLSHSFRAYYDLAIAGLTTFSNKMLNSQLLLSLILFYSVILALFIINKKDDNLRIIFLYGLASLSVVVPIVDMVHATLAIIIPVLFLVYLGSNKIRNISVNYIYLLIPVIIFLMVNKVDLYIRADKIARGIYQYVPVKKTLKTSLDSVSNYLLTAEGQKAYILDHSAALFNLNVGRYNKYFDLFMNGNFGVKGRQEIFDIIDNEEHIFLINPNSNNWQLPDDIIAHVKENYHVCGKIVAFDMYCK